MIDAHQTVLYTTTREAYTVSKNRIQRKLLGATALLMGFLINGSVAMAHGISEESRQTMSDGGTLDYVWLGAEHMVTGYDHLLFLFGVIFFLTSFRDIVRFITAFTLGHCITLLGATMMGITANAYIIDAVIALSVIYKGFENLDGFKKYLKFDAPNLLTMVFVFGLIHGFGLSTRLQELTLGQEGLVSRILAFNVGVELGQILALSLMLGFFAAWRKSALFSRFSVAANGLLMAAGFGLFLLQADGYVHDHHDHRHHQEQSTEHSGSHLHHAEEPKTALENPEASPPNSSPKQMTQTPEDTSAKEAEDKQSNDHDHGHAHPSKADKKAKEAGRHHHDQGQGHSHTHGSDAPHTH